MTVKRVHRCRAGCDSIVSGPDMFCLACSRTVAYMVRSHIYCPECFDRSREDSEAEPLWGDEEVRADELPYLIRDGYDHCEHLAPSGPHPA